MAVTLDMGRQDAAFESGLWQTFAQVGTTILSAGHAIGMVGAAADDSLSRISPADVMKKLLRGSGEVRKRKCSMRSCVPKIIDTVRIPIEACELVDDRVVFGIDVWYVGHAEAQRVMRSYSEFCAFRNELGAFTPLHLRVPFPRASSPLWRWSHRGTAGCQVNQLCQALEEWLQAVVDHEWAETQWEMPLHAFVCEGRSAQEPGCGCCLSHCLSSTGLHDDGWTSQDSSSSSSSSSEHVGCNKDEDSSHERASRQGCHSRSKSSPAES